MRSINSCIKRAGLNKLLAVVICVMMLIGCSDDVLAPVVTPVPTPTDDLGEIVPQSGGKLTLPMPEDAKLGNPLVATSREMSSIYGLIFESLLSTDDSGAPSPGLAETWIDSSDHLSWTFTLRTGVKWQGTDRTLSADDIVFTLDQISTLGKDKPWSYVTDYLKSWKADAEGTLTIELKKPFFGALHALTFPILPEDYGYENGEAPEVPIGTGPYKVTNYKEGKSITLSAYSDWWKKPPWIPKIEVIAFPDNETEVSSMLLSQLDAVQTENLTVTQYRESGTAEIYEYPTRFFEFMAFNFNSPDMQVKQLRQAIAYAIDRREIVSYTYVNHAIVSDTPVPPPPESWLYDGKLLKYDYNPDEAKRLIKLAGWKDTDNNGYWDTSPEGMKRELKFTLLMNRDENNTLRNDAALLMEGQLEKVGITVELKAASWEDYKRMVKEKQFDLALCGTYLSPVPDYRYLLGSDGALNIGGYKSEAMDGLLDSILDSADGATLKVKIGELQSSVIEDLPILCLYFRTHSLLTTPTLHSVTGAVSGAREDSAYAMISQWFK